MYKDKDKQREANRKAMQRLRDKGADSMIPGYKVGYDKAIEIACDTQPMIPSCDTPDVIPERTAQGNIRVSKPGDSDYEPRKKALPDSEPKTAEEAHRVLQGINYAQPAPPPDTPYPVRYRKEHKPSPGSHA